MMEEEGDVGPLRLLERLEILRPRVEVAVDALTPPGLSKAYHFPSR